ncbi:hypothetical protein DUI87_07973 [Hirundo rustica rustica]|uniref:Uncharacterized protein n=1 Tax=Hirundo rustica rustica TaxID=333673 RepID=A0A3M0KR70_HIRRU|nr:hypothetical protein DUI87_07973 [Hirundo rustica rustica]
MNLHLKENNLEYLLSVQILLYSNDETLQVPKVKTVHGTVATPSLAAAMVLASPAPAWHSSAGTCSVPGTLGTVEVAVAPSTVEKARVKHSRQALQPGPSVSHLHSVMEEKKWSLESRNRRITEVGKDL